VKLFAGATAAIGLCVSSTIAGAVVVSAASLVNPTALASQAPTEPDSASGISPIAALSAFSPVGSKVLCAEIASVSAAQDLTAQNVTAAQDVPPTEAVPATQDAPATQGCVLPLVDQPVPVSEAGPLAVAALGLKPLLAALPAAAGAAAVSSGNGGGFFRLPISPG